MLVRPSILIVEDEMLIALDLASQLESAGFRIVGPAQSVAEAIELLDAAPSCNAAVLDVNLGRESAEPVAHALNARGIPFVVLSGYSQRQHPLIFQAVRCLSKPVAIGALVDELHTLLPATC